MCEENKELFYDFISSKRLDRNEGESGVKCLNKIAELLGYKDTGFAYGDSLGNFLQDNPGCITAIQEWIAENITHEQLDLLGIDVVQKKKDY